jgi:Sulfotransferase family
MTPERSRGTAQAPAVRAAPGTSPGLAEPMPGGSSTAPVFIAGPDRSGTTLMFALLASRPNLSMVRRTNMWRYFHRRYGDLGDPANFERCLGDMVRYRRMRHLQPDVDRIRSEFARGEPTYGRLFSLLHEHHAERAGKSRWGDKSLHTEHYADRVLSEFPEARILHMVRDPRDRYASVRKRWDRDVSHVGAATGRWLSSTWAGRRSQRRHPDRYLMVRYEDLATDPETTMQRVCAFIGEDYSAEMLAMGGVPEQKDRAGNSSFGDIEPGSISTRAIGRFRTVLSPSELAFIQLVAGRELSAMGYERAQIHFTPREKLRFYALDIPVQLTRMIGWMSKAWHNRRRGVRVPASKIDDGS